MWCVCVACVVCGVCVMCGMFVRVCGVRACVRLCGREREKTLLTMHIQRLSKK